MSVLADGRARPGAQNLFLRRNFFLGQKVLCELVPVCVTRANSVFSQVLAEVLTGIPAMDKDRSPVYLVREPVTSFSQL